MIRGNSTLMKLLSPRQLHDWLIKEHYDVEIAYLEGPCARIVSGCSDTSTKKVGWIHIEQRTKKWAAGSFRSYREALDCYNALDKIICVSRTVKEDFLRFIPVKSEPIVLYNTNESEKILAKSRENVEDGILLAQERNLIGVGKLLESKGFYRLIPMVRNLRDEGLPAHLYLLGVGPAQAHLEKLAKQYEISEHVTLLGYQTNPYKYVAKADLFVCASFAEGFSTAATEALIVGTPVCTVEVSGMKEMLGENNEWGIVTENDDEALYQGIKRLLEDPALMAFYKEKAAHRGKMFSTENTVRAVEDMLQAL